MAKTKFLASIAGKTLALAAAVMAVGLVLSACSKDKDTPQPVKENFVMIDGQRLEIKYVASLLLESGSDVASLRSFGDDDRLIVCISFSEREGEHSLIMEGRAIVLHSKTIDLTKLDERADWEVVYNDDARGGYIFNLKSSDKQVFDSGSLYASVEPNTLDTEISLTNGKLTYKGKEHTVSLYYKGKARPFSD